MNGSISGRRTLPALLLVIVLCQSAQCAPPAAPFVAGFDRFAQHGEIETVFGGQLLLSELSCTACHQTQVEQMQPKRGPNLDGVATRLNEQWVRKFLIAPQTTKPGTTMPDVLTGLPEDQRAACSGSLSGLSLDSAQTIPHDQSGWIRPGAV